MLVCHCSLLSGVALPSAISDKMQSHILPSHEALTQARCLQVVQWERLHSNRCRSPRLKRFAGRPQDYSPKARLLNFLGYKLPFDRHDWVVDRCGREVR